VYRNRFFCKQYGADNLQRLVLGALRNYFTFKFFSATYFKDAHAWLIWS
jgi:hypothetical protein